MAGGGVEGARGSVLHLVRALGGQQGRDGIAMSLKPSCGGPNAEAVPLPTHLHTCSRLKKSVNVSYGIQNVASSCHVADTCSRWRAAEGCCHSGEPWGINAGSDVVHHDRPRVAERAAAARGSPGGRACIAAGEAT